MQRSILNYFAKTEVKKQDINNNLKISDKNNNVDKITFEKKAKDKSNVENKSNYTKSNNTDTKENLNVDSDDENLKLSKSYKRLRTISDNDIDKNMSPAIKKNKVLDSSIKSIQKHNKGESTPMKETNINEEKKLNSSTKALLSSFSKEPNESITEMNESQFVDNDDINSFENYDHFSYDFLKKENIRDSQRRRPDHPDYDATTLFVPESFMAKLTPGLRQWWKIKINGNMDTILFFKMGKFYETYHMDAVVAVSELGLLYMKGNQAHSGFPEVAFSKMADQLVLKGYKVARVEQTETVDAMNERMKHDSSKNKVVNREICQVITPGTRGFSIRNQTCRETGQTKSEEMNYIDDAGGLLYAFKESVFEADLKSKLRFSVNIGIALVNTNTGKFMFSQFVDDDQRSRFRTVLSRFPPNEIIYLRGNLSKNTQYVFNTILASVKKECLNNSKQFLTSEETLNRLLETGYFTETPQSKLSQFGLPSGLTVALNENDNLGRSANDRYSLAISCVGALIYYLERCLIDKYLVSVGDFQIYTPIDGCESIQRKHSNDVPFYEHQSNMILDSNTLINLDILKNNNNGSTEGTLLERLDFSSTAFGRRLLIQWIAAPLCDPEMINERQDAIKNLIDIDNQLSSIKSILKSLPDLEKAVAKIHVLGVNSLVSDHPESRAVLYESVLYSKRKINDFLTTLSAFDSILKLRSQFVELHLEKAISSKILKEILLCSKEDILGTFPDINEIINFFQNAFDQEKAKKDGKIIPEKGVDADYDISMESIKEIEEDLQKYLEKQKTIMGCNISYFGTGKNRYQLEIPENRCSKIPPTYIASSQKKGFKRYLTVEIENFLSRMINAEEKRDHALKNIMSRVFAKFDEHYIIWTQVINNIAKFDALLSLAIFSRGLDGGPMVRPEIRPIVHSIKPFLVITEGRYPCKAKTQTGEFISNTVKLGTFLSKQNENNEKSVMLLTGPNMGGKSTLMRQTALIIILCQMGCNVPAEGPVILTPVDRLFTRQGANDSIGSGQSTLQVEMNETSIILSYMSEHSFLLIDELGRGTATYDGCALAYSVLRNIAEYLEPRTIFSTHFHKLLEEKEVISKVQISHMACMVEDDVSSVFVNDLKPQNITFLYKLVEGGCPKSYGFNAARLANVPDPIILNGLKKAKSFEEETLILEFKKCLLEKNVTKDNLKLWQQRFCRIYS